jgi:hypothetical protein
MRNGVHALATTGWRRIRTVGAVLLVLALVASIAAAQRRRGRGRGFFGNTFESATVGRWATLDDFDGGYHFCRLVVPESPAGDGAGWNVDYPRADFNLSIRFSELTRTSVSMDPSGEPLPLLVNLEQPEILSHCPFVMMTEPGAAVIDGDQATVLREYLLRGGFLWADDYWGQYAWDFFERQLRNVFPESATYPIVDVPRDHLIFEQVYDATKVPQIPGIGYWDGRNRTWERSPRESTAHYRAIYDERGRMMVLLTHDTDFGDSYEREAENPDYFVMFSAPGYAFGINVIVYAMTH